MKSLDRKELAEIIGVIAIVASLLFVGLEVRQTQNIALAEGFSAVFTKRLEVGNSIKEHIALWRKGIAGEELDDSEAAIFAVLVNQLNESAAEEFLYNSQVAGPAQAQIGAQDFAGFLYSNPSARDIWNRREDHLAEIRDLLSDDPQSVHPWTGSVRNYLARLDELGPQFEKTAFVDW